MNVKFHKSCENTGNVLKISCVRSTENELSFSLGKM